MFLTFFRGRVHERLGATFMADSQDNRRGGRGQVTDERFVSQDFNS